MSRRRRTPDDGVDDHPHSAAGVLSGVIRRLILQEDGLERGEDAAHVIQEESRAIDDQLGLLSRRNCQTSPLVTQP